MPFDDSYSLVHYSDRAVLLVSAAGTSLFDVATRQSQPMTATKVIAAGGPSLIGKSCFGDRCTLTVVDIETRKVLMRDGDRCRLKGCLIGRCFKG